MVNEGKKIEKITSFIYMIKNNYLQCKMTESTDKKKNRLRYFKTSSGTP